MTGVLCPFLNDFREYHCLDGDFARKIVPMSELLYLFCSPDIEISYPAIHHRRQAYFRIADSWSRKLPLLYKLLIVVFGIHVVRNCSKKRGAFLTACPCTPTTAFIAMQARKCTVLKTRHKSSVLAMNGLVDKVVVCKGSPKKFMLNSFYLIFLLSFTSDWFYETQLNLHLIASKSKY